MARPVGASRGPRGSAARWAFGGRRFALFGVAANYIGGNQIPPKAHAQRLPEAHGAKRRYRMPPRGGITSTFHCVNPSALRE